MLARSKVRRTVEGLGAITTGPTAFVYRHSTRYRNNCDTFDMRKA